MHSTEAAGPFGEEDVTWTRGTESGGCSSASSSRPRPAPGLGPPGAPWLQVPVVCRGFLPAPHFHVPQGPSGALSVLKSSSLAHADCQGIP